MAKILNFQKTINIYPDNYRPNKQYIERFLQQIKEIYIPFFRKKQETFPKSGNEGLYGWTIIFDGKYHIREDLIGKRLETIIHELRHYANDEYGTRRNTEAAMETIEEKEKYKVRIVYIKTPQEYKRAA